MKWLINLFNKPIAEQPRILQIWAVAMDSSTYFDVIE
jgi:hypothetical protein